MNYMINHISVTLSEPKMFLRIDCSHDYRLYPEVIELVNEALGEFIDKYLSD